MPNPLSGSTRVSGGVAADRLKSFIERIERLTEEKRAISDDIKDIFAEAKSAGFDVKVLRSIIRIRQQEPSEVEEQMSLLDTYLHALGMGSLAGSSPPDDDDDEGPEDDDGI